MFQTVELGQKVSKKDFDAAEPELRMRLLKAQHQLKSSDFSVVVVISGVEGAGKSETVNILHEWLDPRFLATHPFEEFTEEERMRPPFWRFWLNLPPKGRIGMFFGSWYAEPIMARTFGQSDDSDLTASMERVKQFERSLVDDGTLVVKFWFHLSKKDQKKRLERLNKHPEDHWRVTERDWQRFKRYDKFRAASERALGLTDTAHAPWNLIEGTDARFRYLSVGRKLASALEKAVDEHEKRRNGEHRSDPLIRIENTKNPAGTGPVKTILSTVDLEQSVEKDEYEKRLASLQSQFGRLCREFAAKRWSTLLVFEGWDAAGKGGVIRRVSAAMDARHYSIIPIAAPTDEEKARHYLWRFWRHLPRAGRVTIFDRSWYGRVLVERVEGFASEREWQRAYNEVNEFERQLTEHGYLVHKFWLHIDQDEQLRRFEERERTPWKRFKITEDDWRNRSRWDAYELAVHDMVERTSTVDAPWTLVPNNDKRFGRLFTLETICRRMEAQLAAQTGKDSGKQRKK